jgi:NADP-dependent 3-hydroxy acid dehydrogenase YdfG
MVCGYSMVASSSSQAPAQGWARNSPARSPRAEGPPVLAARRAERLEELSHEIPHADPVACDVTEEADRQRLIHGVIERHGRLDGLINNTGDGATAPAS